MLKTYKLGLRKPNKHDFQLYCVSIKHVLVGNRYRRCCLTHGTQKGPSTMFTLETIFKKLVCPQTHR